MPWSCNGRGRVHLGQTEWLRKSAFRHSKPWRLQSRRVPAIRSLSLASTRRVGRDFVAGIQSPQMRNVTMVRVRLLIFSKPLQDASIGTNLRRGQPRALGHQFLSEVLVDAKNF